MAENFICAVSCAVIFHYFFHASGIHSSGNTGPKKALSTLACHGNGPLGKLMGFFICHLLSHSNLIITLKPGDKKSIQLPMKKYTFYREKAYLEIILFLSSKDGKHWIVLHLWKNSLDTNQTFSLIVQRFIFCKRWSYGTPTFPQRLVTYIPFISWSRKVNLSHFSRLKVCLNKRSISKKAALHENIQGQFQWYAQASNMLSAGEPESTSFSRG